MGKTMADLGAGERAEAQELLDWYRTRKHRSPVQLAELTGIVFNAVFPSSKPEDKLARAMMRGLSVRQKMALEEGGSQSAEETALQLGMTKQSVINLYHAGKLLAWRTEKQGALRFPVWQLAENQRLPGLETVLSALNEGSLLDDWGKIGFFLVTQGFLGDRRPLDLLRENQIDKVVLAARNYVA